MMPTRQSFHLQLAHHFWEEILQKGDTAIDATCGNGKDTLKLATLLREKGGGHVLAMDLQEEAICRTRATLSALPDWQDTVQLFCRSHLEFPLSPSTLRLIVYNLGYLPGGNQEITTLTATTLESVRKGLDLLAPGGALSITCYSGHPEGAREEKALLASLEALPSSTWDVHHHHPLNRKNAPSLLIITRHRRDRT